MYTDRELPFLINRSKPVISSTVPFAQVFSMQTSRPATEKVFTLANYKIGAGLPVIVGVIALILFLGRR